MMGHDGADDGDKKAATMHRHLGGDRDHVVARGTLEAQDDLERLADVIWHVDARNNGNLHELGQGQVLRGRCRLLSGADGRAAGC